MAARENIISISPAHPLTSFVCLSLSLSFSVYIGNRFSRARSVLASAAQKRPCWRVLDIDRWPRLNRVNKMRASQLSLYTHLTFYFRFPSETNRTSPHPKSPLRQEGAEKQTQKDATAIEKGQQIKFTGHKYPKQYRSDLYIHIVSC